MNFINYEVLSTVDMRKDAPDVREKLVKQLREVLDLTPPICEHQEPKEIELFGKNVTVYCKPFEQFQELLREAADYIANGVTVQKWKPISEPPKETGHYLVNIHQENEEKGEQADFVLDAWYQVNGLLFVPKTAGWTLLNEWYDLTSQMLPFVTHWTERPQPPKGEWV